MKKDWKEYAGLADFALLLIIAAVAMAQAQDTSAELKLTEGEVARGRVVGLEQQQLIERRTALIKEIQPQLDQIEKLKVAIDGYPAKGDELTKVILAERKLDPAQFVVNWKDSRIDPKVQAKAETKK